MSRAAVVAAMVMLRLEEGTGAVQWAGWDEAAASGELWEGVEGEAADAVDFLVAMRPTQ